VRRISSLRPGGSQRGWWRRRLRRRRVPSTIGAEVQPMSRGVLLAVALGLALAGWLWRAPAAPPENEAQAPGTARARTAARAPQGTADSGTTLAVIERQLRALQDQLAREAAERQQLAARLDALAARLGDPGAMPATADDA